MTLSISSQLALLFGCCLAMTLQLLAGGNAEGAERTYCYVSVSEQNRIATFSVNPEPGELKFEGETKLDGAPGSLAVNPARTLMYAAVRSKGNVATLKIDPKSGELTPLGSVPVAENPVYVILDQSGRYLLTSYYGAGKFAIYRIGEDGLPLPEPTQLSVTEKNPHSIRGDKSNRYIFVPNTGSDCVLQYVFDTEKGTTVPNAVPKLETGPKTGPRHFTFHPTRDYVYFCNEMGSSVTACRLDPATGRLAILQTISTLPADYANPGNSNADIEITPDGKFLYASNRGHDSLAGYAVDAETGKLTSLGQTPTEKTPREFAIDPSGRFVYAAGQGSGKLAAYTLDQETGALSQFAVYEVGKSPAWVTLVRLPGDAK